MNKIAILLSSLVFLSGCSKITLLRTEELRKVDGRVQSVESKVDSLARSVDDLNISQGGLTSKMKADLTVMLGDLQTQISQLQAEIKETKFHFEKLGAKMDRLEQRRVVFSGGDTLSTSGQSSGSGGDTASGKPGSASNKSQNARVVEGLDLEHLFNQAREDYRVGKYDLAFQGFKSVYEKDMGGSFKDNALYWMGECFLKTNQPEKALEMYQRCIQEFPRSSQVCAAQFKVGLIHHQKKDMDKRNEAWKNLTGQCPGTNEAKRAQEMMTQ